MAAIIQKNELVSTLRQVDIGPIWKDDSLTIAPVSEDFIALGILYVTDPANPQHLKLGTGTCINKRRPLSGVSVQPTATDTSAETITKVGHGITTGIGPVRPDATTGGVDTTVDYWFIRVDDDTLQLVTGSPEDAYAGTNVVDITASLNAVTFTGTASCSIGIPGEFVYTFTQAETNVVVTELWVLVDGGDYTRPNGGGKATASMLPDVSGWSITSGDGYTNQQKLNLAARNAAAPFTKVGNDFQWRKLDDSGDSHSATVTPAGRSAVDITDPD